MTLAQSTKQIMSDSITNQLMTYRSCNVWWDSKERIHYVNKSICICKAYWWCPEPCWAIYYSVGTHISNKWTTSGKSVTAHHAYIAVATKGICEGFIIHDQRLEQTNRHMHPKTLQRTVLIKRRENV